MEGGGIARSVVVAKPLLWLALVSPLLVWGVDSMVHGVNAMLAWWLGCDVFFLFLPVVL